MRELGGGCTFFDEIWPGGGLWMICHGGDS